MKKGKTWMIYLVIAAMLFISMGAMTPPPVAKAAEAETGAVSAEAELAGSKTCTVKKKSGKYYYVNANGKLAKKQGWKKNASGDYTYYVGKKGYVTAKITNGRYYKWKSGKFVRVGLSSYKQKVVKIKGRVFFIEKNGKILKKQGWKKNASGDYTYYIGKKGDVTARLTKGKYYTCKNGVFTPAKITGKATIKKLKQRYYYVNGNSKVVTSTGWKKDASGIYSFYVGASGSVTAKLADGKYYEYKQGTFKQKTVNGKAEMVKLKGRYFYADSAGTIRTETGWKKDTAGNDSYYVADTGAVTAKIEDGTYYQVNVATVTALSLDAYKGKTIHISGQTLVVDASGSVTAVVTETEDTKQETETGDTDTASDHIHRWMFTETTSYIEHPEETHQEYVITTPAWDEPVYGWRFICNSCNRSGIAEIDCSYKTYDELEEHQDAASHGGYHDKALVVSTIHHEAVWGYVTVVDQEAWSEEYNLCTCTVCGDTMINHWVGKDGVYTNTYDKSGIMLNMLGEESEFVEAGVVYTN